MGSRLIIQQRGHSAFDEINLGYWVCPHPILAITRKERQTFKDADRATLAYSVPPLSAINRNASWLTNFWRWKRLPQESGVTSRYSCIVSSP